MARKAARGTGTIRKKTVTRGGKQYTYWEARYTEGVDPGTGKQIQRSITGKTQKEVAQRLKAATASIDQGVYSTPNKVTVGEWLDIWAKDYLGGVRPRTADSYQSIIKHHLKPGLGAIRLEELNTPTVQHLYNSLARKYSAKTMLCIHGVLHKALQQAVAVGYLKFNVSDACTLPRIERQELHPLDEEESKSFLKAIQGHRHEALFTVTLFTGLREGEVLGLRWECVDFERGLLTINKQLQKGRRGEGYYLAPTKNGKDRTVAPAAFVMEILKRHRSSQTEQRLKAGPLWEDSGLVFTNGLGHHLSHQAVYRSFKVVAAAIGRPDARFHDLRHSYAVAAIRSGDDIKTVQGNLGHATAAFTLDVYGHVTEQMKKASAARMDSYIKDVLGL